MARPALKAGCGHSSSYSLEWKKSASVLTGLRPVAVSYRCALLLCPIAVPYCRALLLCPVYVIDMSSQDTEQEWRPGIKW